jgi:hypothetical protein
MNDDGPFDLLRQGVVGVGHVDEANDEKMEVCKLAWGVRSSTIVQNLGLPGSQVLESEALLGYGDSDHNPLRPDSPSTRQNSEVDRDRLILILESEPRLRKWTLCMSSVVGRRRPG